MFKGGRSKKDLVRIWKFVDLALEFQFGVGFLLFLNFFSKMCGICHM